MFRDDYISRQIQILVQILARLLGLTKGREFMDAFSLLQMTFREHLGTDLETLLTVPDDRLVDFLTFGQTEVVALTRSSIAIALLQATAHLHREQGNEEQGLPYLQKGLNLLLEIELAGEGPSELPEFVPTVDELIENVDLRRLTLDSRGTLVFYFEREGAYATAEKVLNTMLADRPEDQEIHDLGVSFYEYLLDESDEKLAEGGLPRGQVITALEQLRTSRKDS